MSTFLGKKWGKHAAALLIVSLVAGAMSLTGALPASAAGVTSVTWSLVSDGTAPFDAEAGDGKDTGVKNGVVRTQDTVAWDMVVSAGSAGTSRFVAILPAGMVWTPQSAAGSVCNAAGGGTVTGSGTILTCNRTFDGGSFTIPVAARVGAVGNGASIIPSVTVDGGTYAASEVVKASATPKTNLAIYSSTPGGLTDPTLGMGISQVLTVYMGAPYLANNPQYFGYEALASQFTMGMDLPAGSIVKSVGTYSGGGTYAFSQASPGAPVSITANNVNTSYLNPVLDPGAGGLSPSLNVNDVRQVAAFRVTIFIPYAGNVAPDQTLFLKSQLKGFDPLSISGVSNFGPGFAPGQEPGFTCPAGFINAPHSTCSGLPYTRSSTAVVNASNSATLNGNATALMYGDYHGFSRGTEPVTVGQSFTTMNGLFNANTAEASATGAYGSVTWDPSLLTLNGAPRVVMALTGRNDAFYSAGQIPATPIPASDYELSYTDYVFANDADRKSRASFADPAITWVTDPSSLAGGINSVSSVRIKYLGEILPNRTLGVITPFTRSSGSRTAEVGAKLPWFWQFGDSTKLVKSTYNGTSADSPLGGNVQAVDALVRANFEWLEVAGQDLASAYPAGNAQRGDIVGLKLTPVVVGPVGSIDSVAKNVKATITMPNACLEPVAASLPSNVTSFTPGVPGTDCMAGTPASMILDLGSPAAPGGPAGPAPYNGHATVLDAVEFPVKVAMGIPIPTSASPTLLMESPSDNSIADISTNSQATPAAIAQDRTYQANLTVSGSSSFKSSMTATTVKPGYVGPGESITYTIAWANASTSTFLETSFVDVLPFLGDRRGTTGLVDAPVTLKSVSAAMDSAAQGNVIIEYTTDPAKDVEDAVNVVGNEHAATGVNWVKLTGSVPAGVTALRFTPENGLPPEFAGSATLEVGIPPLALSGSVNNNVATRLIAETGTNIVTSAGASRPLKSSAALIEGNVYRDLDFSKTLTAADQAWSTGANSIELRSAGQTVARVDVAADGSFSFPLVASGLYNVALVDGKHDGWEQILPNALDVQPEAQLDLTVLYQEGLNAPTLVDDTAAVSAGETVTINVTSNDSLVFPTFAGSTYSTDTVALSTAPVYGGTATLVAGGTQSKFTYAPSATWPAAFAGQTSYVDTFSYAWTNAQGERATARVNVTVYALPVATADAATVKDAVSTVDVLANDTGSSLTLGAAPTVPAGTNATVRYTAGKLEVTPTHSWAGSETTYTVPVTYSITDAQHKTASAVATITVQRPPVATGTTALGTIALGQSATADPAVLNPAALNPTTPVTILTQPAQGTASVNPDGTLTFSAGSATAGNYSFTAQFTDNLGQTLSKVYTVSVQGAPVATGASAIIALDGSHAFTAQVTTPGSITARAVTTQPIAGTVSITGNTITYAAGTAPAGTYTFAVTFTDNFGQDAVATYTVAVQAKPVVTGLTSSIIPMGDAHAFSPTVTTTGSISTVAVTTAPTGGSVSINTANEPTFTAGAAAAGDYSFTVTYTDNLGQTTAVAYTVTVQALPTATGEAATIGVGQTFTFPETVSTTGTITDRTITGQPSNGTATLAAGGLKFVAPNSAGDFATTVTYTDNVGQTVTATFTVTVLAKPVTNSPSAHIALGQSFTFSMQASSTGQIVNAVVTQAPLAGTATLTGNILTYAADSAPAGTYTTVVTYTDNVGQTATSTHTVTVHAPLAVTGETTVIIGQDGSHTFTAGVTPADDLVGVSVAAAPAAGHVTLDAAAHTASFDGANAAPGEYPFTVAYTDAYGQVTPVVYTVTIRERLTGSAQTATAGQLGTVRFDDAVTPATHITDRSITSANALGLFALDAGQVVFDTGSTETAAGVHTVQVKYTDDAGQTVTIEYSVTVQAKPVANGSTATVATGGTHTFARNVQSASTALSTNVEQPDEGSVVEDADGKLVFTAGDASVGDHTFRVTYTDEFDQAATATYTVTVQGPLVIAVESTQTIGEGKEAVFSPEITTTGTLKSTKVTSAPAGGTATVDASSGAVTYNATGATPGTYTFTVEYADNVDQVTTVTYTVTVQAKITAAGEESKAAEGGRIEFTETVTTTGTVAKREIVEQPAAGTAILGSVIYEAGNATPGKYSFVVRYTDNVGQTADATFTAIVQAKPVGKNINLTVPYGTERVIVDPVGAVTGENLQPLTAESFGQPNEGTVTLDHTGVLIFQPAAGFAGVANFTARVADDLGQSVQVAVTISVSAAPSSGHGTAPEGIAVTGGDTGSLWISAIVVLMLGAWLRLGFSSQGNTRRGKSGEDFQSEH
ncbi:Ig-like domain-containing protein [Lysinibacter cavernae]|uniref:Tandem-95 repeat protein n=1 Tax=Lysinibacter cavernae TaxID=1640652 RepID=A0A7X5R150_9MICO|nr:Ig-like domain-containing protein [Lysinibacter cavernae]NIH53718.1 hypothetical protein [Lysinibacter cavernae]